jgi:hypothetical protein
MARITFLYVIAFVIFGGGIAVLVGTLLWKKRKSKTD